MGVGLLALLRLRLKCLLFTVVAACDIIPIRAPDSSGSSRDLTPFPLLHSELATTEPHEARDWPPCTERRTAGDPHAPIPFRVGTTICVCGPGDVLTSALH